MKYLIAQSFLNGRSKRKHSNNTYFIQLDENRIAVRLHKTDIVVINRDNTVQLNTNGWHTVTTRNRINKALRMLFKEWSPWVGTTNDFMYFRESSGSAVEFFDGMVIGEKGRCINYWNRG